MNNDGSIAGQQLDSNEHNKRELISHNGISSSSTSSSRSFKKTFTNQYAIRIEGGDPNEADRLAIKYGYINLGVVSSFLNLSAKAFARKTNIRLMLFSLYIYLSLRIELILPGEEYFLFEDLHVRKRSSRRTRSAQTAYITREPHVQSIEQQVAKKRVKRGFKPLSSPVERRFPVVHQHRLKGNQLGNDLDMNVVAKDDTFSELPTNGQHDGAGGIYNLNDPLWSDMWYLNRATFDRGMDHNVKEAWDLGYTGRGIVVTILDDGLERTHPDIAPNYGRRGRGSIFVWASGNGGKDADSCNCDGYTNSIYTLSISSATEHGNIPWYSEACSSTLATAYSSGATGEKMIVTTDLHHSCTNAHTGTSASAPLAAGIVALTLEANPTLTWRDLQHIVVRTARPLNLRAGDWITNGVGRNVSHSFGFGLMDAGAMVKLASNWSSVPEQHKCIIAYPARYKTIPHGNRLQLQLYTDGCAGETLSRVIYLEHVQSIITLTAPKRGDIQIYLTSPSGTRSTLLAKRARDTSRTGFREWAFMTTHNWGEMAPGLWTLEIDNDGWDGLLLDSSLELVSATDRDTFVMISKLQTDIISDAELIRWDLVMYGTAAEVGPSGGMHSSILMARSISDGYHSDILLMDSSNGRSLYLNAFNFLNLFIFIVYNNIIWCNLHSSCI
ncbi:unnamed protein product [Anisakis simplex]|uniref:Furin-like protease 1 (inferred by orthology to a D. melanogaster protein) n=1 Tax=Anisakis simplex TaxID=6269 RepID=A0A158PMZ8_ANISI|nr:unnamed protein product [Anisakis simplex]